jgi:hypothetical protein
MSYNNLIAKLYFWSGILLLKLNLIKFSMIIQTKNLNGYQVISVHVNNSEQFNLAAFNELIASSVESGQFDFALSLHNITGERSIIIGVIVMCIQAVRKYGCRLALLASEDSNVQALDEICYFMKIPFFRKESELQPVLM